MKVLLITHDVEPNSGWGRYSHEVVAGLRRKGVQVLLAAERFPASQDATAATRLQPLSSALDFLRNLSSIRKAARSSDVVHALDGWPYGVYGLFAVLGTKKPLFINGVGTYSVAPLYSFGKSLLLRAAYRRAKRIFCISTFTEKKIAEEVKLSNLEVVHMGSTVLPEILGGELDAARKKYNLQGNHPVLLTVGQIKDRKGQYETLQAVYALKKTFPAIHYLIVGSDADSRYVNQIRRYMAEHTLESNASIIPDIKGDDALSCLYQLSDIVLLNSNSDEGHFEGFGLVLLEGNQFGKPSIGSRGSGIEDAIRDGYNGLLSESRNPSDIADKVMQIMRSYNEFSSRAHVFQKEFSWDRTVTAYITNYSLHE